MNMEEAYANREIDSFLREYRGEQKLEHDKLQLAIAEVKEIAQRTETQAKRTNGRVSSLENYKWLLMGMGIILTVLIIPLLTAYIGAGKL